MTRKCSSVATNEKTCQKCVLMANIEVTASSFSEGSEQALAEKETIPDALFAHCFGSMTSRSPTSSAGSLKSTGVPGQEEVTSGRITHKTINLCLVVEYDGCLHVALPPLPPGLDRAQ